MTDIIDNVQETATTATEDASPILTIPVEAYISRDYAKAEFERLWSKVWQQVGRIEDIPNVGDFLTYEIQDQSFIIARTETGLRAYHNVCSHRGRRLVDTPEGERQAMGNCKQFVCGYHGWRYNLDGTNTVAPQRVDWKNTLTKENSKLVDVKVDTWGGWVWINLDPDCESLADYLAPATRLLDHFETQKQRFRWRRWLVVDCNWKVALEAFAETYHVPYTHPEFMAFGVYLGWSRPHGIHSNIGFEAPKGMDENQAKVRIGSGPDPRLATQEMQNFTWSNAGTSTTKTLVDAANRLVEELPEGTPPAQVLRHWLESAKRDDAARGVIWPEIDPAIVAESGTAWQIFPNFQIGHGLNNMISYSARPYGDDPDKCIFEAAVYELYPEGEEPETKWEYTPEDGAGWLTVLPQDFSNMSAVQKGMKSKGFSGAKPNPYREQSVVNLHHNLAKYMGTGEPTLRD
ncbi:aromatic ring-hydroxylating oxygenase subunit alpha [Rhodococcus sp. P1Y]|uniref:aromatic ring-hydroxylating oxygenase subunit alpha n=1 Tax=Rhodococcus sp. P1Y TaxID=1302308 RepID=UPI000EAC30C6|nr:aromatic ring-hydroxylating dioxygenase subunit alpha [Rhodococcus sp. P1Y]AYJ50354.1 aromatic ring-hydroxylating dioxygenase subunit alpha [Rhodococcus sp. P1Y]